MAIFKTKTYGKQKKKVIFLLAGWYMPIWSLWPAAKILEKNDFYCVCYAFDNAIFSPNITKTVDNMMLVKNDILKSIDQLKDKGCMDFSIAGGSLGTIIAILVANESKDVTKLILNTTGADPAENVWISNKTRGKFKTAIINQGYTLDKLQEAWRSIIPLHNIDKLKGKKILVYLSKRDEVIPFALGMKLVHAFAKRKYDYQLIVNTKLGHLHTSMYNSFNAKVYLKFLNTS